MIIERKLVNAAKEITGSKYEAEDWTKFGKPTKVFVKEDALESMIEDLIDSYNAVVEKFEDYVKEVDENYKRSNSDPYLEYGVSPQDF